MSEPAVTVTVEPTRADDVRWLALLIRQALLMIVGGIERRYGIERRK